MKNKFIIKYIWGTNIISVIVILIFVIILSPYYLDFTKNELLNFTKFAGGISLLLLILYHIIQKRRLSIVIKKGNVNSIYLSPYYSSLHKLIDYIALAPILFFIINRILNVIPYEKFISGTLLVISIGPIVALIVYFYADGLINEELKKYKDEVKGISMFVKFMILNFIVIYFSFFIGIVFTKFKFVIIYLILPFSLVLVFIVRLKRIIDTLLKSFSVFTSGKFSLSEKINIKTGDEYDRIGIYFNIFLDIISKSIKDMKETNEKMKKFSEVITSSNEEITASVQEISSSLENLNSEMAQTSQELTDLRNNAEIVNAMAENMSSQTMMLKKIAVESEKIATDGIKSIEEVLKIIEMNIKSVGEINEKVALLISSSDEIVGFASMINDVSEDTDLLALNASIEAARVGEMGKGFSVIAEEIRNLSNLSRDYLSKVNETIENVKSSINEFSEATKKTWNKISENISSLDNIRNSLNKIAENIALTTNMTNQVSETIKEEVVNVSSVFSKLDNISKSVSNVSATTQEISASMQQQMASLQKISTISQDLLNTSKELEEVISKYT